MTGAQPQYWFGIPRNVSFPGLVMDIDRYASIAAAKGNDATAAIAYTRQSGMRLSAYEHLIAEKLFTDPNDPNRSQGVSAVKAIALAVGQGQKIYTLNQANQSSHATLLAQVTIDASARQEIQNALAAGKEVTVHQSPITQSGWTGSGYIITDPGTGAGAYKISGGANGAFYVAVYLSVIVTLVGLLIAISGVSVLIGLIAFAPFMALNYYFQNTVLHLDAQDQFLINYATLLIVFAAAFLAPEILIFEIGSELLMYSYSVLKM